MSRNLRDRLGCVQREMSGDPLFKPLDRIAVALYDPAIDVLRSFLARTDGDNRVEHTVIRLADVPSLRRLAATGERCTINDLGVHREYGTGLITSGSRSSHIIPICDKGTFYGFLSINSIIRDFFTTEVIQRLRSHVDILALLVIYEINTMRMIRGMVSAVHCVLSARDEEMAGHLVRMAHYARLVATKMVPQCHQDDEFLEHLFLYCQLHDIGKTAIPDSILFKPTSLTEDEKAVMRTHVEHGTEIINKISRDCGLHTLPHFDMLRNIVTYHHEAVDGSGYPFGCVGDDIPLEARIAAVADVFDALTSRRSYKWAWTTGEALALMRSEAGRKFDSECVAAMLDNADALECILSSF